MVDKLIPDEPIPDKPVLFSPLDSFPDPSNRLRKGAAFFRIGIGAFLLLSGLLALVGCSSAQSSLSWRSGSDLIDDESMFQLVLDNVSTKTPVDDIRHIIDSVEVSHLGQEGDKDLLLVRFNAPILCGRLGCLHTIVEQGTESSQIWNQYLHSQTPTTPALKVVPPPNGEIESNAYACLELSQLDGVTLHHDIICYDGDRYQIVEQRESSL